MGTASTLDYGRLALIQTSFQVHSSINDSFFILPLGRPGMPVFSIGDYIFGSRLAVSIIQE